VRIAQPFKAGFGESKGISPEGKTELVGGLVRKEWREDSTTFRSSAFTRLGRLSEEGGYLFSTMVGMARCAVPPA